MLTSKENFREVVRGGNPKNAADRLKVLDKIMVGGAPITQEYADKLGADAYTADAASAAKKAKELVA